MNSDPEQEINMTPQQIGLYKIDKHQTFIREWIKGKTDLNFDLIWIAREEWIGKLSQK